jgi:hypothetical protein
MRNSTMDKKVKFNLALIQINNIAQIVEGNNFEQFFVSHLLPVKFEIERQLALIEK